MGTIGYPFTLSNKKHLSGVHLTEGDLLLLELKLK